MMAMFNSEHNKGGPVHRLARKCAAFRRWPGLLLSTLLAAASFVPTAAAEPPDFAARSLRDYEKSRQRFQADTNNTQAAWQFSRACFEWAEFATNDTQRAELAERLFESLDTGELTGMEKAWAAEAKRRRDELASGKVQGIPGEEVFAEARRILGE